MSSSAGGAGPALRARWLTVAVVAVVVLTVVGVFVVPWLVPQPILNVASDSQAVGFNNRTAVAAAAIGALLLAALGFWWGRSGGKPQATGALVSVDAVGPDERVPLWLILACSGAALTAALAAAVFYRSSGISDAAYFIDRVYYLVNGDRLYTQVEFDFGPLLVYPIYYGALALRQLGMSVANTYYLVVGCANVLGYTMLAYCLNRLRMPRQWRLAWFGFTVVFGLANIVVALNYTPIRFIAPFFVLLLTMRAARRGPWAGFVAAAVGTMTAAAVSPEVGMVSAIVLCVAFGGKVLLGEWRVGLLGLVGGALGEGIAHVAYTQAGASAVAAFAQGAYNFPIFPVATAALALAATLLAGWGTGLASGISFEEQLLAIAWLAGGIAFLSAAFGRADIIHVFWDGLPILLLATTVSAQRWPQSGMALALGVALAFLPGAFAYTAGSLWPQAYQVAASNGVITKDRAGELNALTGRPAPMGRTSWSKVHVAEPKNSDIDFLAANGPILALYNLHGRTAVRLSQRHALITNYAPPQFDIALPQSDITIAQLARARYVLVPVADYRAYMGSAAINQGIPRNPWGMMLYTSQVSFSWFTGFPWEAEATFPQFNPSAYFGQALQHQDWVIYKKSGDYFILQRYARAR